GAAAEVSVDGKTVGSSPLEGPLYLLSGPHQFRATRAGALPDERQLAVVSGGKYTVELAPVARDVAQLRVATTPPSATLALDERPFGLSPWQGEVAAGGNRLVAELEGYNRSVLELTVAAGQSREVSLELS